MRLCYAKNGQKNIWGHSTDPQNTLGPSKYIPKDPEYYNLVHLLSYKKIKGLIDPTSDPDNWKKAKMRLFW